jgi:16S rRNA (adenine1518-N6/adenine1519-N6)-dimethyltransferase
MLHPKQLLDHYGLDAKKSLGQNFLFDDNILSQIADVAELTADDAVLEIGPGVGALTHHLARRAGKLVAVELDDRLLPILRLELQPYDHLTLVHGDILEQNPADWFVDGRYKVVANVPYYITAAILRHLVGGPCKPSLLVMTVQKEVADRLTAAPPNMSLLAVSVQFYGRPAVVNTIKAGAFWPRPDVDSAVIKIDLTAGPDRTGVEEKRFFSLVKTGFSQKRKQLGKNLRALPYANEQMAAALEMAGIDGRRRAETLLLDEWLALYRALWPPTADPLK